ncbi:neprilysin-like 9 [Haematobia irritans]|uniref:neprilysin-like 9 n=1 Tax=Haematobia irritans TaxID=7368 RepID=UPI003F505BB7
MNHKQWWSKNLVFIFLILLGVITEGTEVNITNIYRDYLKTMMDFMDGGVSPCEDFFAHACGKSVAESTTKGKDEPVEDKKQQGTTPFLYNHQDFYEFFEAHKGKFLTQPGILVRNVYELCKEAHIEQNDPRRVWWHMIRDVPFLYNDRGLLRKWPFLQYQWEIYEPQLELSWPILAAEFAAHGYEIFFSIFFADNTIYITPKNDFLCPDLDDLQNSLLPLMRQRNPQIANIVGSELWQFCRQLRGEIPLSQETIEVTDFLLDETMSDYLQRFFPRLNLTDEDIEQARKIVVNVQILGDMMTVLKSTNARIVYNYIVWHIYKQFLDLDDCFQLTDEFRQLLQAEYWQWNVFDNHFRRDVAIASYLFHTTRFQRHYRKSITSSSVERMFQKRSRRKNLNIEKSIRQYAKTFLNPDNFTAIYQSDEFLSEEKTFFASLLEMKRLSLRYSFYNSYVDDEKDMHFFQEFINFCILILYRPRLHYFASYDQKMWKESTLLYNADAYITSMDCLERQTMMNNDDYGELFAPLDMAQVEELFDFHKSFLESLADYKFWLESENFAMAEDFILEYFHMDYARVMFYAVAQQMCNRNDHLYSWLINRSFMNTEKFQDAFECSSMDPMNPTMKCMTEM